MPVTMGTKVRTPLFPLVKTAGRQSEQGDVFDKPTQALPDRLRRMNYGGDLGRIRTCDQQLRRLLLYPLSYEGSARV